MTVPASTIIRTGTGATSAYRIVPEDLADVIELVAQEDTPFTSNIGRGKAKQTLHEWNTDALAAANDMNAAIEGDDATNDARPLTSRLQNYNQIMRKVVGVSGTMQAINIVGDQKELARQLMKAGRELKLDREKRMLSLKPAAAGSAGVAYTMAGFGAFLTATNSTVSRGATGTDPGYSGSTEGYPNAQAGDGTNRTFAEDQVKTIMQGAYAKGGKPKMLIMGPALKAKASTALIGVAANRLNLDRGDNSAKIIGTADIYVSDFGSLSLVPDAYMPTETDSGLVAYFVDPEYATMMTLRPVQTEELAKTGDSERRMMIWEGTLRVDSPAAHGGLYDVITT